MSIDEMARKLTNTMPIIKSQRYYLTPLTTRNIILAAILLHRFLTKPLAKNEAIEARLEWTGLVL